MKSKQKALRATIEVQVAADGGLDAVVKELQSVQARLRIGGLDGICIEGYEGYKFRIEETKAGSGDFPKEQFGSP